VKRIETLLNREIGLCASSIGSSAVECAARSRMLASGSDSVDDYVELLAQSPAERRRLVEEIVVSETWFFRDEDVFRVLTNYVSGVWRKAYPQGVLRLLSVPCATGEEAYSTSIALLQAGLSAERYEIQAVDVSERALSVARLAVFGKNSFRGINGPERLRYFKASRGGQAVVDEARASVKFSQGNVLAPGLARPAAFNVIFCRNLLIYLDRTARARALDNIYNWLAADGILFGGHAEALETIDPRFERSAAAGNFGFVKRKAQAKPVEATAQRPAPRNSRAVGRAPAERKRPPPPAAPPAALPIGSLALARQHADAGHLALAVATCEQHIQRAGVSAEAFCLLGVLHTALGDTQSALDCFSKAVYLDPAHYDALSHLALVHERRGETAAAQNFRRRAKSALEKGAMP
jgi:chemotaxis protein methyltransferase WspC